MDSQLLPSVRHLQEHGYCIIPQVAPAHALQSLRAIVDWALNEDRDADPLNAHYLPNAPEAGVLYDVAQRYPGFWSLVFQPDLVATVTAILGLDVYLYVNSIVTKTAGAKAAVPWHQDFLSRPDESEKLIAWVALDDAGADDGPIVALPGMHKRGFLPWSFHPGEVHHSRLDVAQLDVSGAVQLEVKAGDAVLFSQYLPHGSAASVSRKPRRAFRCAYKALDDASIPRATPIMVSRSFTFPTRQPTS